MATRLVPDLGPREGDDEAFVSLAGGLVDGVVGAMRPEDLFVVEVDNWFGPRWLGFAGNTYLGLVSVHRDVTKKKALVIPPFVPKRVVSERRFALNDGRYVPVADARPLHGEMWSQANLDRPLRARSGDAAFVWVSGGSRVNGRASMMVVTLRDEEQEAWYAGFVRRPDGAWAYGHLAGVGREQLDRWRVEGSSG